MAEKSKRCPACGGEMSFRLGSFECAQCGRTEQVAPPPTTSGPGLQRRQPWQSSSQSSSGSIYDQQSGYGAPPPPPAGLPQFLSPPDSIYSDPEPRIASEGLDVEKRIFFGLQVAGAIFQVISGAISGVESFMYSVFVAVIGLVLAAYVLFSDVLWLKYTCIVTTILYILGFFGVMFGLAPFIVGATAPIIHFAFFVQIGLNLWLITILIRDTIRLQGQ